MPLKDDRATQMNQPDLKQIKNHLENFRDLGITEVPVTPPPHPSPLPQGERGLRQATASLQDIRETIGDCKRCKLCEKRTHIVFGVGDPHASLMFVGEGPGRDEDLQGEPFVGRAGQLLTKMIEAMGMKRSDVYIANIVKCRPPDNRYPEPEEVATCYPFLLQQIAAIRPRILVSLGNLATQTLLKTKTGITTLHGTFHDFEGTKLMPTYHPAFLLRNPPMKKPCWEDLQKVMAALRQ